MFQLPANRIYILPTGYGVLFLLSALAMILTGATYSNNLVYILAFLLFSIFFVSMVHTHANLVGLRLHLLECLDAPAGDEIRVNLQLESLARATRQALEVEPMDPLVKKNLWAQRGSRLDVLPSGESKMVSVTLAPRPRGLHALPGFRLSTTFPLGLFRAWMRVSFPDKVYVYPRPEGELMLRPQGGSGAQMEEPLMGPNAQGVEFEEHRKYVLGESYRRIDWKVYARGRPLMIKNYAGEVQENYSLKWEDLAPWEEEKRLSQLALWVRQAQQKEALYELRLPTETISWGSGKEQFKKCQRSLAAFSQKDVA